MLVLIRIEDFEGMAWLRAFVAKENIPVIPREYLKFFQPADYGDALYEMNEEQLQAVIEQARGQWISACWRVPQIKIEQVELLGAFGARSSPKP